MTTELMLGAREVDGCVSPSLMFATCRYRWQKTIIVTADTVIFVTVNNKVGRRHSYKRLNDQNSLFFITYCAVFCTFFLKAEFIHMPADPVKLIAALN